MFGPLGHIFARLGSIQLDGSVSIPGLLDFSDANNSAYILLLGGFF